jgi:hypothetical protein
MRERVAKAEVNAIAAQRKAITEVSFDSRMNHDEEKSR